MSNLLKEKIVIPAWNFIKNDSKIKIFYLIPWLLSIIFLTAILVYQSIYTYVELFWNKEEALVIILNFFHSDYIFEIIVTSILFLILYIFTIPIFEWWLIKYLNYKNTENELSITDSIWQWIYKFLPLFEYNNIFSEFKLISIINAYLFTIRFIGINYFKHVSYAFIIIFIFWLIINLLFSYSKYIIVLDNKNVFKSIWISSKITILNLWKTIRLYFFIFMLNFRVIFNFIVFLIFPILMVIAVWLITSKIFLVLAISILLIIFVLLILALWYLNAVLEVFKTSLWYFAYLEWKKKLDEWDMDD